MATEPAEEQPSGEPTAQAPAPKAAKKSRGTPSDIVTPRHTPRDRKQVDFYKPEEKTKSALKIEQGKGTKLGDIPNAHFKLAKLRPDDEMLTALHSVLYRRQGTGTKRKKNIFEFSGFPASTDEAKKAEVERVEEKLAKWTMLLLNKLLDCLDLPRGAGEAGQKASKIERVVEFLMEPKILGKKNIAEEAAKKKALAKKRKLKQIEKLEKKRVKPKTKKRKSGGEPRPRGRPKKVKESPPMDGDEGRQDKAAVEAAEDDAEGTMGEDQSNGLTEETIRSELINILEAADLNNVSITQVIRSLADALGQDVTPWKPLIKKVAVKYTEEHVRAQLQGEEKPEAAEGMGGDEDDKDEPQDREDETKQKGDDPMGAEVEGEDAGPLAEERAEVQKTNGVETVQDA